MPPWLLERLHAMGLLVLEAYGLSECIVPVAANRPGAFRFGTVGRVMRGNEIRLAADGELLLRSDGVFEGYLGGADAAGSVDAQGWLATGDFAQIDGDGFVRLVGRKSEVFKTSTGRRVAPGAVEAALRALPGVEHAAVFGAGRQSLLAVVALAADAPGAVEALRNAAARTLQSLPDYQRPAGLVVTRRPFTIESGELTGNLKLRRHSVREHYSAALDALAAVVDGADARRRFVGAFEPGIVDLVVL
jgi:long-chain acyl-CoA synthetase